ncbi:MAG TPA: radical SAM/SPASM domain-containing protein [Nanoarchaeota archaeon]|nr:radical SAM/SPASM domain-containing protein [Nanoarchaeota archaeon]
METKQEKGSWLRNNLANPELHMTGGIMKLTLDKLAEGGVRNILFTGGGEPLMHPLAIEAMEHAKRNGNVIALYTNGRLLNKRRIGRILELDPLFVRISVYGGNQETVARYTQTSDIHSFEAVIRNIAAMAEEKGRVGSKMNLGLSYLIHPITAGTIDEFADAILRLEHMDQIDYIRFTPAVNYSSGRQHDQKSMEQIFQNIEANVAKRFEGTPIKLKLYYHRLQELNRQKSYTQCRASGWFVEVGPTGDLFLCCETHFKPEYRIGDLKTQSLDEIWRSDLRKSVIARVNNSSCHTCPTLCKPNELNKIFDDVEQFRDAGEIGRVERWAKDLIRYGVECGYCPGKLDDFQS